MPKYTLLSIPISHVYTHNLLYLYTYQHSTLTIASFSLRQLNMSLSKPSEIIPTISEIQ